MNLSGKCEWKIGKFVSLERKKKKQKSVANEVFKFLPFIRRFGRVFALSSFICGRKRQVQIVS